MPWLSLLLPSNNHTLQNVLKEVKNLILPKAKFNSHKNVADLIYWSAVWVNHRAQISAAGCILADMVLGSAVVSFTVQCLKQHIHLWQIILFIPWVFNVKQPHSEFNRSRWDPSPLPVSHQGSWSWVGCLTPHHHEPTHPCFCKTPPMAKHSQGKLVLC